MPEHDTLNHSTEVASAINSATSKTPPVDADELGLIDSAASNVLKKLTWANLKAAIKSYLEGLASISFTGSVSAGLKVVTQAATDTLTAAECKGCVISNYGQSAENTQTLPAAAEGLHGMVVIGTSGAGAFHLKAGAGDKIYLDGTALDDGDKASLATPAVGDNFTFFAFQTGVSTYDWIVTSGSQGVLTDGGA